MRDNDTNSRLWQRSRTMVNQENANGQAIYKLQREFTKVKRRIVGGVGGIVWASAGRIYDKDNSYSGDQTVGEWVWVSPADPMVITGTADPDSGLTVKSYPGTYLALQNVSPILDPDHPDDPSKTKYHIPQPSLPVPNNLDDPKNYWLLISPAANCLV